MKLAHQRPKLALFALMAQFLAGRDRAQRMAMDPGTGLLIAEKRTSHGGLQAFNFDRRRAHLKRMKYRRAHG